MRAITKFLSIVLLAVLCGACGNNPQPEEGKLYVQTDKGLLLPVPGSKDKKQLDYTTVKVTFESDGVYMRTKQMLDNAMVRIEFKEPQFKPAFGHNEYNVRVGLKLVDSKDGWNIYKTEYPEFRKYAPYWTWEDVEGVSFLYLPEGANPEDIDPSDFETPEAFREAYFEKGFDYTITIYRDAKYTEELNDPKFDEVFKLFKAHTQK